jgi:ArsR family transcriptional regulator
MISIEQLLKYSIDVTAMTHEKNCCNGEHEGVLKNAYDHMPDEETLYELSDLFKVFSDSTRLRILWAMEGGEICVCGISELLGISVSAVSHQLKTLKQANLVKARRDGKNIYYSLDDHHVKVLLDIALEHMEE